MKQRYIPALNLFIFMACIVYLLVMCAVPPVSRDALTHHLLVPKIFLKLGRITELPEIVYSYYPMNIDMLYMFPLAAGRDFFAKYIHLFFGIATCTGVFFYLKKRMDTDLAATGGLLFLSLPVVLRLSTTAYVDLGLAFFSFSSMILVLEYFHGDGKKRHLFFAAISCGLAMGSKYNGLVTGVLLTLATAWLSSCQGRNRDFSGTIRVTSIFAFLSLLVASPWFVRNLVATGNPFYPLFPSIFSKTASFSNEMGGFAVRKLILKESFFEIMLIPIRIFFQGADNDPRLFDGRLNPYLLLFPLLILLGPNRMPGRDKKEVIFFSGVSIAYILVIFFARDMRVRYLMPVIPCMAVLAAFGLKSACKWAEIRFYRVEPGKIKGFLIFTAWAFIIPNLLYLNDLFIRTDPLPYITGRVSRQEYIERFRPEYAVISHANRHLEKDAKIFALFLGERLYYFDMPAVGRIDRFYGIVKRNSTASMIKDELIRAGFTHLMIGRSLFLHWSRRLLLPLEIKRLDEFIKKDLKRIYSKNGYNLYEILDR